MIQLIHYHLQLITADWLIEVNDILVPQNS